MGKWGSEEETNIPLFSLMRKNFHRTISFIINMFTDFYHGKYVKSSWISENDVQIFVAEMQYIFSHLSLVIF